MEDRFRVYVSAQRKSQSFQRAANLVFLAIVVILLAGAALGLMPEREKLRELDQRIAVETARLEGAKAILREKKLRLSHLQNDVDYMEAELRNSSRLSAKPGETLILVPPDRQAVYEGRERD